MIKIAVLGAGHWGPNLIRNFHNQQRSVVRWVVDLNADRLSAVRSRFPEVQLTGDAQQAIRDPEVDAVVIATPTVTHYELVKQALLAGKHVMVEKPLTERSETGHELVELAEKMKRVLLVGHIFIYNPAVQWVKKYIDAGELGRTYYVSSQRTNLGPIRMDVNASWDLASQDIAIFNYWLGGAPVSASAVGGNWINPGIEDAVFATLRYPDSVIVHLHVSWLNPRKAREITVVADKRMLTYDDMNLNEPLRIYDKQVTDERIKPGFVDTFASFRASVRDGDIRIPRVAMGEPLRSECDHFLDCVAKNQKPITSGAEGLVVVRALEAIERSMKNAGREEKV